MRIGRLKALLLATKEQDKTVEYNKLIAWCMEEFDVARRTAREYVDQVYLGGFCEKQNILIVDKTESLKDALKPIKKL
tara:strand:+ start:202 stop:435 length:234 start_codon:yes stop_codon:yes gene_type:complete